MNVYLDSSVILRVILGEPERLGNWRRVSHPVASELILLECLRTLDRNRVRLALSDVEVAQQRADTLEMVDTIDLVALDSSVLARAAGPFPTMIGSLDAIHLASAILAREEIDDLRMATHDEELGLGARAMGFEVLGLP